MSRYTTTIEKEAVQVKVAWGYDHACGFFFQLFDAEGECIEDLDSLFDGLTIERLCKLLDAVGVDSTVVPLA